jgi:hypothetical protein
MANKAPRPSPDEIFEELKPLRLKFELRCLVPDENDPEHISKKDGRVVDEISFGRDFLEDLKPDPDFIADDLTTNAAIYARYQRVLVRAQRFLARVKQELAKWRAIVYISVANRIHKDPDIEPKLKTVEYIKAQVDIVQSILIMTSVRDDAEEVVAELEGAMEALKMKHFNCLELAKMRQFEARMIGSSAVPEIRDSSRGKRE